MLFTIRVTDLEDNALSDTKAFELCVVGSELPLTVVTRTLPSAIVNQEYFYEIAIAGGSGEAVTYEATGLPNGLTLAADGAISGQALESGSFGLDVTVRQGTANANRTIQLMVSEQGTLRILTDENPEAQLMQPIAFTFQHEGGTGAVQWRLVRVDDGLTVDLETDGRLIGTPTQVGTFELVVEVRDDAPEFPASDTSTFLIDVADDGALSIRNGRLPAAVVGVAFQANIGATGGRPKYEWSVDGRLPDGIKADVTGNELVLQGLTTEDGTYEFTALVTDQEQRTSMKAFQLQVGLPPPVAEESDDSGCTSTTVNGRASTAILSALAFMMVPLFRRRRAA